MSNQSVGLFPNKKKPIFIKKSPIKISSNKQESLNSKNKEQIQAITTKKPIINKKSEVSFIKNFVSLADDLLHHMFSFLSLEDVLDTVTAIISNEKRSKNVVNTFQQRLIKIPFQKHHIWKPEGILRFPILKEIRMNIASISNISSLDQFKKILKHVAPSRIKTIEFSKYFSEALDAELFSEMIYLESLDFGISSYNQSLKNFDLPQSLKILKFVQNFDQPLHDKNKLFLPEGLEDLELGFNFNQPLQDEKGLPVLPASLKNLKLGYYFNQPLLNNINSEKALSIFPKNLKVLYFSNNFNQSLEVGILPEYLEELYFGGNFNQPLKTGTLSKLLKVLHLGYHFNQPLHDVNSKGVTSVLPEYLKKLYFGDNFNQPLYNERDISSDVLEILFVLPKNLEVLHFGSKFDQSLGIIHSNSYEITRNSLKISRIMSKATLRTTTSFLPKSLNQLVLGDKFNRFLYPGIFPEGLKSLEFGHFFNKSLNGYGCVLPKSLKRLYLGPDFDQSIEISENLETLEFYYKPNKNFNIASLSKFLKVLKIEGDFNESLKGLLSEGLEELVLGYDFNQPLGQIEDKGASKKSSRISFLPKSLKILKLGHCFSQPLSCTALSKKNSRDTRIYTKSKETSFSTLPENLEELCFGECFNQPLGDKHSSFLPKSLKILEFGDNFNQTLLGNLPEGLEKIAFWP